MASPEGYSIFKTQEHPETMGVEVSVTLFTDFEVMAVIVIDGLDGCGKSTQAKRVHQWLNGQTDCILLAEPGGTPLGERLREIIKDPGTPINNPMALTMLFCAARAELCEKIEELTSLGQWVVLDRFTPSTLAYQGVGDGIPAVLVKLLDSIARGSLLEDIQTAFEPDLTIILDIPLVTAIARMQGTDRIESRGADFYCRVAKAYGSFATNDRLIHVDGTGTEDEVFDRIKVAIETYRAKMAIENLRIS
jgi:dTMP kinase